MPVSAKKRISNDSFNAKCGRVEIRPQKPVVDDLRATLAAGEESTLGYILDAVLEKMQHDGFTPTSDLWPDYTTK